MEEVSPGIWVQYGLTEPATTLQTEKSVVTLTKTRAFGKMITIDGQLQSAEKDEYIYHEMLVHPFASILRPTRVKIYGGGEGATAREVLKWSSVTKVIQVDWDRSLVDLFKGQNAWGASWSQGAYEDPRMELRIEDAWIDCKTDRELYDYIIVDLPDQGSSPAEIDHYTDLIYHVKKQLTPKGGFVLNGGPIRPWEKESFAVKVLQILVADSSFTNDFTWKVHVPSFAAAGEWCFMGCLNSKLNPEALPESMLPIFKKFSYDEWLCSTIWSSDYPDVFRFQIVHQTIGSLIG